MKTDTILLSHGSGGRLTRELIKEMLLKELGNEILNPLTDSAILPSASSRLAFTTDSYVVSPIFFPGGDIGRLAVFGTVNDLSVMGATPLYLSLGFIIEEGFSIKDLERIVGSVKIASEEAGIKIVTGDTKVIERGKGDGIFINTSGIGVMEEGVSLATSRIERGDRIIVSGTIGEHGAAVMSKREGLGFEGDLVSDCAPLNHLTKRLIAIGDRLKFMRDPTRGGLAGVVNEIAEAGFEIMVMEGDVPVRDEVRGFCDILGIEPLYLACEGRVVMVCAEDAVESVMEVLRQSPDGTGASVIGEVAGRGEGIVYLKTPYGTRRILDMPVEDNLPRIC